MKKPKKLAMLILRIPRDVISFIVHKPINVNTLPAIGGLLCDEVTQWSDGQIYTNAVKHHLWLLYKMTIGVGGDVWRLYPAMGKGEGVVKSRVPVYNPYERKRRASRLDIVFMQKQNDRIDGVRQR